MAITEENTKPLRLDQFLVEQGFCATRSRARDAIRRGTVSVNGKPVKKPAAHVSGAAKVTIDDAASSYVSRAALKLVHGLDHFGLDPADRICLDIGASTGGFTQILLERGAQKVFAIDVGHGQMHTDVAVDPRVLNMEGLNARDLSPELFDGEMPDFIVSDVSFISLKLALPPALNFAAPGSLGLFLVKPQFEVGREHIGKGGIVTDMALARQTASNVAGWLDQQPGWSSIGLTESPIEGGSGNREFLLAGRKHS